MLYCLSHDVLLAINFNFGYVSAASSVYVNMRENDDPQTTARVNSRRKFKFDSKLKEE